MRVFCFSRPACPTTDAIRSALRGPMAPHASRHHVSLSAQTGIRMPRISPSLPISAHPQAISRPFPAIRVELLRYDRTKDMRRYIGFHDLHHEKLGKNQRVRP
jgi:hypothetical protein